jgi:hypothetical protein
MIEKHDREAERREAERAVSEAGGGESEGFELAEQDLIRQAEGVDDEHDPVAEAGLPEAEVPTAVYGEADKEHSSERPGDDHDG